MVNKRETLLAALEIVELYEARTHTEVENELGYSQEELDRIAGDLQELYNEAEEAG